MAAAFRQNYLAKTAGLGIAHDSPHYDIRFRHQKTNGIMPELEANCCRGDRRVAMEVVFVFVVVVVAQVECDRSLVDDGAVAETSTDRIVAPHEGSDFVAGAGVPGYLPVVVANDANHEPLHALQANCPFKMKLIPTLVVGRGVLEVV